MAGSNGESTSLYEPYEQKFAGFISVCEKANPSGKDVLIINHPEVIGDDYDEIVESLNRISDAGLNLAIVSRKEHT